MVAIASVGDQNQLRLVQAVHQDRRTESSLLICDCRGQKVGSVCSTVLTSVAFDAALFLLSKTNKKKKLVKMKLIWQ